MRLSGFVAAAGAGLFCSASVFAAALPADTGIDWGLSPVQVTSVCQSSIDKAVARIKDIESQPAPTTFTAGLGAIEAANADLTDETVAAVQLTNFSPSKDVRDASNACAEKIAAFGIQLSADPVAYAIAKRAAHLASTQPERQLVKLYLETGRRTGAELSPAKRDALTKLFDQLNNVALAYQKELNEEKITIHISQAEFDPLPAAFQQKLTKDDSGYVVPVNESTASQFLENEPVADARHRYTFAYRNKGGAANVQRLADAVKLRDEIAHRLGFKTWADYQLDVKMAKTPARVTALLNQVDDASLPKARSEIANLAAIKAASGDASPFVPWDYAYYEKEFEKTRYAIDNEQIRPYFPVTKVIPALFAIYEKLLSVKFEEIEPAQVWAPGVTEYDIVDDKTGKPIAWFYMDLYPREGKYTHFATFPFLSGRVLPDGTYQKPVGAVIGNWPAPAPGQPSLLSHGDVVAFFHEFGHLMHHCLTRAPFETEAGTNVRNDFVEGPSQMLENWMWQPAILKQV